MDNSHINLGAVLKEINSVVFEWESKLGNWASQYKTKEIEATFVKCCEMAGSADFDGCPAAIKGQDYASDTDQIIRAFADISQKPFWQRNSAANEFATNSMSHIRGRFVDTDKFPVDEISTFELLKNPSLSMNYNITFSDLERVANKRKEEREEAIKVNEIISEHMNEFYKIYSELKKNSEEILKLDINIENEKNEFHEYRKKLRKELEQKFESLSEKVDALEKEICTKKSQKDNLLQEKSELDAEKENSIKELKSEQKDIVKQAKIERDNIHAEINKQKKLIEAGQNQLDDSVENTKRIAADILAKADNEKTTILEKAKSAALQLEAESNRKAEAIIENADNFKNSIFDNSEKLSTEAYIKTFHSRISELDDVAVNHSEKLIELHIALGNALEKFTGVRPGIAEETDSTILKATKLDKIYRLYSQKIAEYKADENLDPDIRQAAILGLQEQMERQVQEISGAFEPE